VESSVYLCQLYTYPKVSGKSPNGGGYSVRTDTFSAPKLSLRQRLLRTYTRSANLYRPLCQPQALQGSFWEIFSRASSLTAGVNGYLSLLSEKVECPLWPSPFAFQRQLDLGKPACNHRLSIFTLRTYNTNSSGRPSSRPFSANILRVVKKLATFEVCASDFVLIKSMVLTTLFKASCSIKHSS
jgi:hypothetical protein